MSAIWKFKLIFNLSRPLSSFQQKSRQKKRHRWVAGVHTCHGRGWRHRGGGVRSSVTAAGLFCGVDLKQATNNTIRSGILPCSHYTPHSTTTTVHTTTMKQNKKHTAMPKQYFLTWVKCDKGFCCNFYGMFYVMDKPEGQFMRARRQQSCITERVPSSSL